MFSIWFEKAHNNFELKIEINPDPKLESIVIGPIVTAFKAWINGETI
jgi:hypothetical protein